VPGWTPVVIMAGSPQVLGIASGDLLEVEVELDAEGHAWPDGEWLALFREYAMHSGCSMGSSDRDVEALPHCC
jgi:hypothetical protein